MGTPVSLYKLVFPIVSLLLSLCSARTTLQRSCESMRACYHRMHLSSSDARPLISPLQDSRESRVLSPEVAPALLKHSPRASNELSHHDSLLGERSTLSDSIHGGYKMIWRYAEAIVNSAQAYERHHRIYEKLLLEIKQPASPTHNLSEDAGIIGRLVITYGSLRLIVENMPGDHNALDIIHDFAVKMLSICTVAMTFGVYQLFVVAAKTVIMISLTIIEFGPVPELIGR